MPDRPIVELVADSLRLQFPYSKDHVAALKSIGNPRWDAESKTWTLPHSQVMLDNLKKIFVNLEFGASLRAARQSEAENEMEAEARKYVPAQRDVTISDFKFHTDPLWHQKVTFNFCRALDQSAIFLEQGLGKTKIAIDLATWRFRQGKVHRVLYVAPNSVVPQWRTEDVLKHLHPDFNKVSILDGSSKDRMKLIDEVVLGNEPGWLVVNFEALLFIEHHLDRVQGKNQNLYQMMILDESSKIKHAQSQRSKVCWRLGNSIKYRNIMTGTPITQSLEDIFSQFRFVKSSIFGPYATAFRGQYLILGGFEQRQTVGYRNIKDFYSKLFSVGIRFTKDQCLDLPAKVYEKRTAVLDLETSKKYRQLEKECILEMAGKKIPAPLAMTRLGKLSQITSGFVYEADESGERIATHRLPKNPKLDVLREILDEVGEHKKVIIWTKFTEEIKLITEYLQQERIGFTAIHGGIRSENRGISVEKFQTDPTVRIFVGQVDTASLGITLTAASVVIYFSNTYSYEARAQSEDRNHRIGQKNSILYIDILAQTSDGKSTIDHDVLEIIKAKKGIANAVSNALIDRMMTRNSKGISKISINKDQSNRKLEIDDDSF